MPDKHRKGFIPASAVGDYKLSYDEAIAAMEQCLKVADDPEYDHNSRIRATNRAEALFGTATALENRGTDRNVTV